LDQERTRKTWAWWALAALGIALLAVVSWLIFPEEWKDRGSRAGTGGGAGAVAGSAKPVQIDSVELRRDYGNAVLSVRATIDNRDADAPLPCLAPDVRLLTGTGNEEVPPFFLATREERVPSIAAGELAAVELLYWLEERHVQDALTLEIRGKRTAVKSAKAFDLSSLENGKTRRVPVGDW
jgi:hypothetical protein